MIGVHMMMMMMMMMIEEPIDIAFTKLLELNWNVDIFMSNNVLIYGFYIHTSQCLLFYGKTYPYLYLYICTWYLTYEYMYLYIFIM